MVVPAMQNPAPCQPIASIIALAIHTQDQHSLAFQKYILPALVSTALFQKTTFVRFGLK